LIVLSTRGPSLCRDVGIADEATGCCIMDPGIPDDWAVGLCISAFSPDGSRSRGEGILIDAGVLLSSIPSTARGIGGWGEKGAAGSVSNKTTSFSISSNT